MNRKISTAAAAVLMLAVIICAALPAFASSAPTRDGVYEVSVKMYHAQKDKTSMGDKYLVHTALLTVKNGRENSDYSNARKCLGDAVLVLQERRSRG